MPGVMGPSRRDALRMAGALAVAAPLGTYIPARSPGTAPEPAAGHSDNVVLRWNTAILNATAASAMAPPVVARALAIVNTAMYDAWAAYTPLSNGTQFGGRLRRPPNEWTTANKSKAMSYAAFRAAANLWPTEHKRFTGLMRQLGFDPALDPGGHTTPPGVGLTACAALMAFRQHDGSNQLGDLHPGAYSDYTGYEPKNAPMVVADFKPSTVRNPSRWQPLVYVDHSGKRATQKFAVPHWNHVVPFSLPSDSFGQSLTGPPKHGSAAYTKEAEQVIALSAGLTDEHKMIAEYWQLGPLTVQPPGRWIEIGQHVSRRDHHSLDQDAKMFFALGNAVFDAGIAAWNDKRVFDSARPITSVRFLFHGKKISAWAGPGKGTRSIDGGTWSPYQKSTFPTPPFAEYVSAHSAFSGAAAQVLQDFTGSDHYGGSVTFPAGSSLIEPGHTPRHPVTLSWPTFTSAANEAGISRRYGGIHFEAGDLDGRKLGFLAGTLVTTKANQYILGLA